MRRCSRLAVRSRKSVRGSNFEDTLFKNGEFEKVANAERESLTREREEVRCRWESGMEVLQFAL